LCNIQRFSVDSRNLTVIISHLVSLRSRRILFYSFLAVGGVFILLLATAIIVPFFFKDEINVRVKREINKRVNAVVDYQDFDLSLLSNFPYLSIQLDGFNVKGKEAFAKDTLINLGRLEVAVNVMNVLRGEKMEVKKVILDEPTIHAKVLTDGKANWDIMIPDTTPPSAPDTAKSSFDLKLTKLKIKKANLTYDDKVLKIYAVVRNFNFTGSGDMTADLYDFATEMSIAGADLRMEDNQYFKNLVWESDIELSIDNQQKKFVLKDNKVKVNDLQVGFDGFFALKNDSTYDMDLKFKALETSFKEILSLVPGAYTEQFKNIKTEGTFALNGVAKGTYSATSMPTFNVNLMVKDGFLQYPDLPAPVRNINVDVNAYNTTDNIDNTNVHIKRFHCDLENNPIDARVLISGLKEQVLDGFVKAKVDLGKITRIFPVDKMELKGLLTADATFKGQVTEQTLPVLTANVDLKYGYVKYKDFPTALQNLTLTAKADCPTGHKSDMVVDVTNFHTEMDNEPIDAQLHLTNLESPEYRLKLKGNLDLAKITKIYPVEGMKVAGKIKADVDTEGSMAKIESKAYDELPTTGSIECQNIEYSSKDLAQNVTIRNARLEFTPDYLNLANYEGTVGSSDVNLKGKIENYLGYLFKNQSIKGTMNLVSRKFNVNEWMTPEETPTTKPEDKPLEPVAIPANIDFVFSAAMNEILYDKWNIQNLKGDLIVRDQAVQMKDLVFKLLGARFKMDGSYDSKDIKKPAYTFDMKIDSLQFQEAYKGFDAMKKLAPIAEKMEGGFGTECRVAGLLDGTMMPIYNTMNASGSVDVYRGVVSGIPILEKISDLTKLNNYREIRFRGTKLAFQIIDGRLHIDPFDIKRGEHVMTIQGSTGIDQSIDYKVKLDVPAPAVAGQAADALSKLVNRSIEEPERLNVKLNLGGTYPKPNVTGGSLGAGSGSLADQAKTKLKDELDQKKKELKDQLDNKKKEAEQKLRDEADRKKRELEDKARQEETRLREEADRKKREAEQKVRDEADKKKREAEQKAKEEADRLKKEGEQKLKDKLKFPR